MKYRRLDSNWDYTFGSGKNNYLSDLDAVAQAIKSRLLLLYKEWWEDQEDGLPLFEKILGTNGGEENRKAVDIIFSQRISQTEGVVDIVDFSSSFDNRQYVYECIVETIYGKLYLTNKEE